MNVILAEHKLHIARPDMHFTLPNLTVGLLVLQDPFLWTGSDVRIREPDMPTIHFAVAFKGASWSDPDSVALMVMQVRPLTPMHLCMTCLLSNFTSDRFHRKVWLLLHGPHSPLRFVLM